MAMVDHPIGLKAWSTLICLPDQEFARIEIAENAFLGPR